MVFKTFGEFCDLHKPTVFAFEIGKLHLTGQNLGRVFSSRSGWVHAMPLCCYEVQLPNLKFRTNPNNF
jgi:hypothetical protein